MPQDNSANFVSATPEIYLDGVAYALIRHNGADWRLGSLSPLWREEIAALGADPAPDELRALAEKGIWLVRATPPPPLAVMCCGLGAQWPGMGRGLYDNFPAARMAMDELASLAEWNLLRMMDESGDEKINGIRWQIPWLFTLEYAQWAQLRSLGLCPDAICGHSIGELTALCLAGVYDSVGAWYLLNSRARYVEDIARKSHMRGGMLAISAEEAVIADTLAKCPALHMANRNTPRQFVLSGPRDILMDVRKHLRKSHIPAFMLNINLAFHNPAMRVLRDISVRRLNTLDMRPALIPMISCVTAGSYPQDKNEICEYIGDLDENTVDWPAAVNSLRNNYGIGVFLELGPQEVLCGLTRELAPDAICLGADRKDNEVAAMRSLCARLFSMGYLSWEAIQGRKTSESAPIPLIMNSADFEKKCAAHPEQWDKNEKAILQILSRESGMKIGEMRRGMDLRHDLGLRSSRFPVLVAAAEKELGRSIELENIFPLVTVGDLINFFLGIHNNKNGQNASRPETFSDVYIGERPIVPYCADHLGPGARWRRVAIDPAVPAMSFGKDDRVLICVFDKELLPGIWLPLAPLGMTLAVPSPLLEICAPLQRAGAKLVEFEFDPVGDSASLALDSFSKKHGAPTGIFFAPDALKINAGNGRANKLPPTRMAILEECARYARNGKMWLKVFQRWLVEKDDLAGGDCVAEYNTAIGHTPRVAGIDFHVTHWLDNNAGSCRPGDMLALDILYCPAPITLWKRLKEGECESLYKPSSSSFDQIFPDLQPPLPPQRGFFQYCWQISRFALPELSTYGPPDNPRLPLSVALCSMLNGVRNNMPWLDVLTISNLRIGDTLALPSGVTRECRVQTRNLFWVIQEKILTRLCAWNAEAREISENGRHRDTYVSLFDGESMLGKLPARLTPLWETDHAESAHRADNRLELFYNATDYGERWRLLKSFRAVSTDVDSAVNGKRRIYYEAGVRGQRELIAGMPDWEYKNFLPLFEAVFQGCVLAIVFGNGGNNPITAKSVAEDMGKWRCGALGLLRLAKEICLCPVENFSVELRESWRDDFVASFDAQVMTAAGECALTLLHLEFNKIEN